MIYLGWERRRRSKMWSLRHSTEQKLVQLLCHRLKCQLENGESDNFSHNFLCFLLVFSLPTWILLHLNLSAIKRLCMLIFVRLQFIFPFPFHSLRFVCYVFFSLAVRGWIQKTNHVGNKTLSRHHPKPNQPYRINVLRSC